MAEKKKKKKKMPEQDIELININQKKKKSKQSEAQKKVKKRKEPEVQKKVKKRKEPEVQKKVKEKKSKKKWLWRLTIIIEVILLVLLSVAAYAVNKYTKINQTTLDTSKLEMYKSNGDYTNIALFGLDSREGELEGGAQSDCIMIASINNSTNEVNVVSVYRDTLMKQSDDTYEKANYAYNVGGPSEAIAMLNRNLDLDIEKYISVNFNALADVIDALGGVDIDLTEEEVFWTNGYCTETSKVVGRSTTELSGAGVHTLDGIQAVSYARIRYTEGDDYKRTERQRTVLEKVFEKTQKASFSTLNKIVDSVFPQVSTNLTIQNILGMAANATSYKLGQTSGFPFDVDTSENIMNHEGSYVVPVGMADNVSQLHKFLFKQNNYEPSDNVKQISNDIIYLSGIGYDDYDESLTDGSGTDYGISGSDTTQYDGTDTTQSDDYNDSSYDSSGSVSGSNLYE